MCNKILIAYSRKTANLNFSDSLKITLFCTLLQHTYSTISNASKPITPSTIANTLNKLCRAKIARSSHR